MRNWMRRPGFLTGNVKVLAVVACMSLVLGGGAYAASKISGKRLKNHSVSEKKLTKAVIAKLNRGSQTASSAGPVGPAGAAGANGQSGSTKVSTLAGSGFDASNASCSLTPDGFECGPYADGGANGGSLCYNGLNGQTLSTVKNLVYFARYRSTGDTGGVGVPYLRIFLNNDNDDVVFSPNTQSPDPDIAEGPFHTFVATSGSVRYDDDPGNGPDSPFATVQAAHANEVISGVCITTGFSAGTNLDSLIRSLQVNGTTFNFGS